MMNKFLLFVGQIIELTPSMMARRFKSVHEFRPYDGNVRGFKYAIYYGKLYFLRSNYKDGRLDTKERNEQVDKIIDKYKNPTSWYQYIQDLKELRAGVEKANAAGFFSVGDNEEQNKIEAEHYESAIFYLNLLIKGTTLYPRLWRRVFLKPS